MIFILATTATENIKKVNKEKVWEIYQNISPESDDKEGDINIVASDGGARENTGVVKEDVIAKDDQVVKDVGIIKKDLNTKLKDDTVGRDENPREIEKKSSFFLISIKIKRLI